MSTDTFALIFTIVSMSVGATWVLRSQLATIETVMRSHVEEDARLFGAIVSRITKLEQRKIK